MFWPHRWIYAHMPCIYRMLKMGRGPMGYCGGGGQTRRKLMIWQGKSYMNYSKH